MSTSAIPCRYWVSQGRCFFGSDCKYLHSNPNSTITSSTSTGFKAAATTTSFSSSSSSSSIVPVASSSVPVSRANQRASFRPLAILSDDGLPVVQPSFAQPAAATSSSEQPVYEEASDDSERQPATIYSGGDYHSPLASPPISDDSIDPASAAAYAAAVYDGDDAAEAALLDDAAALSLYDDPSAASATHYTIESVAGPASGLPAYPTQPSGHVSLPARSLTATQSTAAQSPSPQFMFADNSGLAVLSQPRRSFFMNETLRERLLFHQQLTADRLQPEGQRFTTSHSRQQSDTAITASHLRSAVPLCCAACQTLCSLPCPSVSTTSATTISCLCPLTPRNPPTRLTQSHWTPTTVLDIASLCTNARAHSMAAATSSSDCMLAASRTRRFTKLFSRGSSCRGITV